MRQSPRKANAITSNHRSIRVRNDRHFLYQQSEGVDSITLSSVTRIHI